MALFEVVVLENPTPKEKDDGAYERLVLGPKAVVAADSQAAALSVVMDGELDIDRNRMKVLVRPFS